jgi:3-oxoacyl-[acyl-carrier-protein] synthase-3
VAAGGALEDLRHGQRNIGSEALNAWMYHRASRPNPFDLLGAMYIIEGLGKRFAGTFACALRRDTGRADVAEFYEYHAEHDADHVDELKAVLDEGILDIPGMDSDIIRVAKVTARLYLLQLEEVGRY